MSSEAAAVAVLHRSGALGAAACDDTREALERRITNAVVHAAEPVAVAEGPARVNNQSMP